MSYVSDNKLEVLTAYSKGQITWRSAASKLMLDKYEQLEALMQQSGLTMHQPTPEKEACVLEELKNLFVNEICKASEDE